MIVEEPHSLFTRIRRLVAGAMEPETFSGHMLVECVIMTIFAGLVYLLGWQH